MEMNNTKAGGFAVLHSMKSGKYFLWICPEGEGSVKYITELKGRQHAEAITRANHIEIKTVQDAGDYGLNIGS